MERTVSREQSQGQVYELLAKFFGSPVRSFRMTFKPDDRLGSDLGADDQSLEELSQKLRENFGLQLVVGRGDRIFDIVDSLHRHQEMQRLLTRPIVRKEAATLRISHSL